nr:hypothetical protein [uncultured Pseudomonas sp.]
MNNDEEKNIWNKIVNPEDYEESADMLIELKYTHRELAEKFALEILQNPDEEIYYQATAFDIFYSINQPAALDMIRARLGEVNLIVLRSMIECVNDDIAILEGNDDLLATVKAIDKRVDALGSDELEKIRETVEEFKELFERYLS